MSTILAPFFNIDNETDGIAGVSELAGCWGVTGATLNGNTWVYASGYNDAGIQIFSMAADGQLTAAGSLVDDASNDIRNPEDLQIVTIGADSYLLIKGYYSMTVARIDAASGALTVTDTGTDDATTSFLGDGAIATAVLGGTTYVVTVGEVDDAVTVFSLDGTTGTLTSVAEVKDSDNVAFELDGATNVHIAEVASNTYVFVAGYNDSGVSVFRLNNNGSLTNTDNVTDSGTLELANTLGLATAVVDGVTYLYAGGFNDRGISVFRVNNNGTLTSVADYDFGTSVASGLYGPAYFAVREFQGANVLIAPAFHGDGLVAYSIEPGGGLVEIGRVLDAGALELNGPNKVDFIEIDGREFILASGYSDAGLSVFEAGGDDDVLGGTTSGDFIFGFAGDDVLGGKAGNDDIFGGDGDDVLVGHAGGDLLHGGRGADVLVGRNGSDTASYNGSAAVTIDLLAGTASGGDATGDILLDIENLIGSDKADDLAGDNGANRIDGGLGANTLTGRGGDDVLIGGAIADTIYGGGGNDRLIGGAGANVMEGGLGDDELLGGKGVDVASGGAGADFLRGGAKADMLDGGADNDTIEGGAGKDQIRGGSGDDTLTGDGARDTFIFVDGDGSDLITDFTNGKDRIDLSGHSAVSGFGDISSLQFGANLLVQFGASGDTVVLENFLQADLDASDFIF